VVSTVIGPFPLPPLDYLLLAIAAFFGGMVNSMAGGGGLITLPALLAVGVPPHLALGTNKVQSATGASFGIIRYIRRGIVEFPIAITGFVAALLGSYAGARTVLLMPSSWLETLLPVLVGIVGITTFIRRDFGLKDHYSGPNPRLYIITASMGLTLGFYDGFFGPGTGSFLVFCFVLFHRFGFLRASANAKFVNLASNYAAILAFLIAGRILWIPAALMGIANMAGSWTGAGLAIRRGTGLIKPVFGAMLLILLVKLLFSP
jgi:uncharacterized protein